jgi:GH24 family phage-related lysozyme (muramidase)
MDLSNAISICSPFTAGFETFSANPYWDVNGYAIGYGNHYYEDGSAVSADDDPISQADATGLLNFYLAQNGNQLIPQITAPLTDNQLAALLDIRYRCGTITTALLNLINSGAAPDAVAAQIEVTCNTVNGLPDQGEQARADAEAALYQESGPLSGNALLIGAALVIGGILLFD